MSSLVIDRLYSKENLYIPLPWSSHDFMLIDPSVSGKSVCDGQSDRKSISLSNFIRVVAVHIQLEIQSSTVLFVTRAFPHRNFILRKFSD